MRYLRLYNIVVLRSAYSFVIFAENPSNRVIFTNIGEIMTLSINSFDTYQLVWEISIHILNREIYTSINPWVVAQLLISLIYVRILLVGRY